MNFAMKSYSYQNFKDLWNTLHPNLKFFQGTDFLHSCHSNELKVTKSSWVYQQS